MCRKTWSSRGLRRERVPSDLPCGSGFGSVFLRMKLSMDGAGDPGGKVGPSFHHRADGPEDLTRFAVLRQVGMGPCVQDFSGQESIVVHREGDDFRGHRQGGHDARRLHAVHPRHGNVQQDDIGIRFPAEGHGRRAVPGFPDDDDVGAFRQDPSQHRPRGFLVVSDANFDCQWNLPPPWVSRAYTSSLSRAGSGR